MRADHYVPYYSYFMFGRFLTSRFFKTSRTFPHFLHISHLFATFSPLFFSTFFDCLKSRLVKKRPNIKYELYCREYVCWSIDSVYANIIASVTLSESKASEGALPNYIISTLHYWRATCPSTTATATAKVRSTAATAAQHQ